MVKEFLDVLPEYIIEMPQVREMEFHINLQYATTISKAPYRMNPAEMKEFKTLLKELLDKGYIRPNVS